MSIMNLHENDPEISSQYRRLQYIFHQYFGTETSAIEIMIPQQRIDPDTTSILGKGRNSYGSSISIDQPIPIVRSTYDFIIPSDIYETFTQYPDAVVLDSMIEAIAKLKKAREEIILKGIPKLNIDGLLSGTVNIAMEPTFEGILGSLIDGKLLLENSSIMEPALIMSKELYTYGLSLTKDSICLSSRIKEIFKEETYLGNDLNLILPRKDTFDFATVFNAQSPSVGFKFVDENGYHMFVTQSFTIRVNIPHSCIALVFNPTSSPLGTLQPRQF